MRKGTSIALLVLVLIPALPLVAQDEICPGNLLEDTIAALETHVTEAREAQDAGNTEAALSVVEEIGELTSAALARCGALAWQGDNETLVGPVEIPAGYYQATVVTEGYFIAKAISLDGECGDGPRMYASSFFNVSAGDATDGAESLVVSEGCTALVEIENISAPWELTLERVG